MTITLYGLPHSLYTGKARAYLRKQGIAYRERPPSDPRFAEHVVPQIKRGIVPVVELEDGRIFQDTVDIIDHFEDRGDTRFPARPGAPALAAIGHLFELYAVVGLTRHAMHYRWSYLDRQEAFLRDAFGVSGDEERTQATMNRMHSYLPMLGVNADTIPEIEASYRELLGVLTEHFARWPYLLGGRPGIGDYALFGPLFAHLGRDPVPLEIMQKTAPKVFRWVERMHAPDLDAVEYGDANANFAALDDLLPTLGPVLNLIARELQPDLLDRLSMLEKHVKSGAASPGAPVTAKPHQRVIGQVETAFRGVAYTGGVQPYTFFLWQRMLDAAAGDTRARAVFAQHGMADLIEAKLPIRVERAGHLEVWGERTD
jgi:glutathione S-transferase